MPSNPSNASLARRCHAITNTGKPCASPPLTDQDFCMAHAPAEVRESRGFIAANGKGGRPRLPRATEVVREKLEEKAEEIVGVLIKVALDEEQHPDVRMRAIDRLFDRGIGKPVAHTEFEGNVTLDLAHLAALASGQLEDTA